MNMARLFVFNPENDLALACGEPNFTPPAMARKIKRDLQLIQIWLCEDGYIYAPDNMVNTRFIEYVKSHFTDNVKNIGLYDGNADIDIFSPWGWSRAVVSDLRKVFPLATDVDIEGIRTLSHRMTSIFICECLKAELMEAKSIQIPVICKDEKAVIDAVSMFGECMIKAPWSGSGKGVFRVDKGNFKIYYNWIRGIIQKQGAIICEKYLNKVQDFALEFYSDGKNVKYIGPSIFVNNSRYSYEKAMVASPDILERHLRKFMPDDYFDRLKNVLIAVLKGLVPEIYTGYFGIDMLAYNESGELKIMPCVELNLRMTMGLIANRLGAHILECGKIGEMSVLWHKDIRSLKSYVEKLEKPVIENGRLKSGSMLLTPVYQDSNYTALLTVMD